ncbi:hypothetical protein [Bradyrhizobium sp. BR 1432]|uniref:hypothetical protein n=1 Tax=Bradyrhizobium sp. BR 1432 TaxID=3447966 RepID=UPI003EE75B38
MDQFVILCFAVVNSIALLALISLGLAIISSRRDRSWRSAIQLNSSPIVFSTGTEVMLAACVPAMLDVGSALLLQIPAKQYRPVRKS